VGRTYDGIFEHLISRLKTSDCDADRRTEALLHSLAYAHGRGMPVTGGIWETAASAISDDLVKTSAHIGEALKTAGAYVMQGNESGDTVYRLAHRAYVDHYRQADRRR